LHPNGSVHSSVSLSEVFTPESIDAPLYVKSKSVLSRLRTINDAPRNQVIAEHPA